MAKYKIHIDHDECIGDRACSEEAPETFCVGDDNKVTVTDPHGDPPEHILAAAKACPLDAITLEDSATGEKVWPRH